MSLRNWSEKEWRTHLFLISVFHLSLFSRNYLCFLCITFVLVIQFMKHLFAFFLLCLCHRLHFVCYLAKSFSHRKIFCYKPRLHAINLTIRTAVSDCFCASVVLISLSPLFYRYRIKPSAVCWSKYGQKRYRLFQYFLEHTTWTERPKRWNEDFENQVSIHS